MKEILLRPMSPRKVDAHLRGLLSYLGLKETDTLLLKYTKPRSFEPEPLNCHLNTWCQFRAEGGRPAHGWVLAQDKGQLFSEAIFHTVWESPAGKLVDTTPRLDAEKRLLFVRDRDRTVELTSYEGRPALNTYDSVRMQGVSLVTPLRSIQVVMQSSFAERQGLWPW